MSEEKRQWYEERIRLINRLLTKNEGDFDRRLSVSKENIWLSKDEMGALLLILRENYTNELKS